MPRLCRAIAQIKKEVGGHVKIDFLEIDLANFQYDMNFVSFSTLAFFASFEL